MTDTETLRFIVAPGALEAARLARARFTAEEAQAGVAGMVEQKLADEAPGGKHHGKGFARAVRLGRTQWDWLVVIGPMDTPWQLAGLFAYAFDADDYCEFLYKGDG